MDDKEIKAKQRFISGCSKVFIGSVIILLVIVIVNPANKCSDFRSVVRVETNENSKLSLAQEFSKDSLKVISSLTNPTYEQYQVDDLISLYNKLSGYPSQFDSSKSMLLRKINSIKVFVQSGTIYLDEFTEDTIKEDLKKIPISFLEYMSSRNSGKYVIKKIESGFKNSVNKKAYNLYIKYSWSKENCIAVAGRGIYIGMNKEMVIAAWGRPYRINKTTNITGVQEQWVYGEYGSSYVYFEDNIVTTIQN